VAKKFYGFRFNAEQYASFKRLATAKSLTATQAFEQFMSACLAADDLVFPNPALLDFEVEARVLCDWLSKGKRLYRKEDGEEVNIQGRLLWLLPKVHDAALKKQMETALKQSVTKQQ
jgi:hypothetical protein